MIHAGRTDVDPEIDVPVFGREDDTNTQGSSWVVKRRERRLYRIWGDFWRNEWIEPGSKSPRVRGDKQPSACSYIVDASGARRSAGELKDQSVGRYLWFAPTVIRTLAERRGGSLEWYTRETGGVGLPPASNVHFGINAKGLITVYAYDVACLPEWQQQIWMGCNVSPDGGVSAELLSAQQKAVPANTMAPEPLIQMGLVALNEAFRKRWGSPVFRRHEATREIGPKVHRFRALDISGLLALAKDIARLTADAIDVTTLHKIVPLAEGETRRSLKSLETVLGTIATTEVARKAMGPLFGIYELRLGDAHLPSSEIDEAFKLVGVDRTATPLCQGLQLLDAAVEALFAITEIVKTRSAPASS